MKQLFSMKITLTTGESKVFQVEADNREEAESIFISNIDSMVYDEFVKNDENASYELI